MRIEDIRVKTSFLVEKPTIQSVWEYISYLTQIYAPYGVKVDKFDVYTGDYEGYRVAITVDKKDGFTREDDTPGS